MRPDDRRVEGFDQPSLLRFLTAVIALVGLIYGGMYVLANWFEPKPREITVSIPPDKYSKQR